MAVTPFTLRIARPAPPLLPAIEAALEADGPAPVRWAIAEAGPDHLLIEGARWCVPASPSSI